MTFAIEYPTCGYVYEATTDAIRCGDWRHCPACDPVDDTDIVIAASGDAASEEE